MTISAVGQNLLGGRPANVPAEYVVTPFGYMHPSCVVHVRKGERVGQNLLHHADGTVVEAWLRSLNLARDGVVVANTGGHLRSR